MSGSLTIGRLVVTAPFQWYEAVGDPVTNLGGAVIPAPRQALRHQVIIGTLAADGATDTLAARYEFRRQLRSMLNNLPLKLQGYFYIQYADDPEQNGWYVPDAGQLADGDGASGLATGWWKLDNVAWLMAGRRRTNREARNIFVKDLRTGFYYRDTLRSVYSTDFASSAALVLSVIPPGASRVMNNVSGQRVVAWALPTCRDGGVPLLLIGLADLSCVSYERDEAHMNLGDVVCYDRRGQITAPTTGPDTTWEEVYGPDYQWNWMTGGQPADAPVLDNGRVRVRWDGTNTPGFRVDAWDGAAYVEQGKMLVQRVTDGFDATHYCDTWAAAFLREFTFDRAVAGVDISASASFFSFERVYITVTRGIPSVKFEVYPASTAGGAPATVRLVWEPALTAGAADANASVIKIDSGAAAGVETAGTVALFPATNVGASSFASSENWVALLRCPATDAVVGSFQATFAVLQSAAVATVGTQSQAYGVSNDFLYVSAPAAGYVATVVGFRPTASDQVLEAESYRNASGTTSQVADATASGGQAVQDTQTAATHPTLSRASNLPQAKYRMRARVKVDSGATGSFKWAAGTNVSGVVTSTSTAWAWKDLGEVTASAANATLTVTAWRSAGVNNVYVDRTEIYLVEDRVQFGAQYGGSRDRAQSILNDVRALGAIVSRTG